jgi:hypothetical protein
LIAAAKALVLSCGEAAGGAATFTS